MIDKIYLQAYELLVAANSVCDKAEKEDRDIKELIKLTKMLQTSQEKLLHMLYTEYNNSLIADKERRKAHDKEA